MISGSFEVGGEHLKKEEVIVSIDHHLVLKLIKMQEGVEGSRVVVEGGHLKLPPEIKRGDFL